MNNSNSEQPAGPSPDLQHAQYVNDIVQSLQFASDARRQSDAHYEIARTFDHSDPRYAEHVAQGDELALEAERRRVLDEELDEQARKLGEHIVQHEAVPEYSSKEAISVIDLR